MNGKLLEELRKAHNMYDYDLVLELTTEKENNTRLAAQRNKAYIAGGFRERYAMDNGTETRVKDGEHECLRYDYDRNDEYQDANGAMWDMAAERWIY